MPASVTLTLASGSGIPGSSVSLDLTIASLGGAAPTAVEWTFSNTTDVALTSVVLGASGISASKTLSQSGSLCIVSGINTNVIPDGVLATATFQIAASPSTSPIPIDLVNVSVSDANANAIPATETFGALIVNVPLSVNDSATVTESLSLVKVAKVSVNDTSTVAENVNINPVVTLTFLAFDSSSTAESVSVSTISGGPAFLTANDSSTVADSITIKTVFLGVSVSDSSTVTESIQLQGLNFLSVSDSSTITELVSIQPGVSTYSFTASDSSTISESAIPSVATTCLVFDASTGSESVSLVPSGYNLSVSESSTVTESISFAQTEQFSVSDSSTVAENVAFSFITDVAFIAVNDSVAASESVNLSTSNESISVNDSSIASDVISIALAGSAGAGLSFLVFDSSGVTEFVDVEMAIHPEPPHCILVPPPGYASPLLLLNEPVEQVGT